MKTTKFRFDIGKCDSGARLDHFLSASLADYSRKKVKKLIDSGGVYVNGKRVIIASIPLREHDSVELYDDPLSQKVMLRKSDIIYEDDHLVAVNKPASVPIQASYSSVKGTLLELVEDYYRSSGKKQYVRLIHRLDKGTTGVIILSKNADANKSLTSQFRTRKVKKEYVALVAGMMRKTSGAIETEIAKVKGHYTKYENAKSGGKRAVSLYELAKKLKGHSLVLVRPETGRTHQIRVHLAHIGHPILGDELYGGATRLLVKSAGDLYDVNIPRVMLHAAEITIAHPKTRKRLVLKAKLPKDMNELAELLNYTVAS